ncbi:MAG: response regulator transcription factor [Lachnospiraceae bacterium]|nr:response regulator transcription factor [Lachnospiraceae bacterium]
MYRIALCDDEQAEIIKTTGMLSDYKKIHPELDLEIETFDSAEKLLENVQEGYAPELILMDIYMDGKDGIEAGRVLRRMGNESRIIFLTASEKHAVEAFRVDATQYLVKPVPETEFFALLDKQFETLYEQRQKYVTLEMDNKIMRVMVRNVVYCEAQGKRQYLHLTDGTQLCVHMSMAGLEELFRAYEGIIRVGKWYIINMDHVEGLDSQTAQMDSGQRLYLSREAYQSFRKQYITYYTGEFS